MIEAKFLFELLVRLFTDPPGFDRGRQRLDGGIGRHVRHIILLLAGRTPFADEPHLVARHALHTIIEHSMFMTIGHPRVGNQNLLLTLMQRCRQCNALASLTAGDQTPDQGSVFCTLFYPALPKGAGNFIHIVRRSDAGCDQSFCCRDTLFTLDWLEKPELRRQTSQELNKGGSRNTSARAVFIHRLGEIRDRTFENRKHRASGLNLINTAIILWNTRYLARSIETMRKTEHVPDDLLAHLSPLGWEHVNLTGDYIWGADSGVTENIDGMRPLRAAPAELYQAA